MPNTKSAIRRVRRIKLQTSVNRMRTSKYRSIIKLINSLIDKKKKNEAKKLLPKFNSQIMKIAKTGVIKKKTASRNISRISKKIYSLK
jgi:small subunit ribosomal protein S20